MSYELFIGLRYLKAKRKQTFISIITLISILEMVSYVCISNTYGMEEWKMKGKPLLKKIKNMAILFFAVTSFFLSTTALAGSWNGWIYQNPYPTSNTLLAVKFIIPQKGWIAGEKGTILYTEDGGETWEYQESGTEQDIKSITFANDKQGWAVGNGGTIIHTEDGGKTWKPQGDVDATASLNKVFFINEKEGWTVGATPMGIVLHTTNGGKAWEKQETGIYRSIASIYFLNSQTGWILAGDEVYSTKDGGKKWDKTQLDVKFPKPATSARGGVGINISEKLGDDWRQGDIYFTDEKNGWVVVGLEYILHTEDGGKTWINQHPTGDTSELRHIAFRDTQNGCAIGSNILCTEDGGKTWNEKLKFEIGDAISLKGISFAGQSIGWAVGADGTVAATGKIMKTEDGGKTWKMVSRKEEQCGGNTFFINKKTGWVHGYIDTFICRTDDGGQTWEKQDVGIKVSSVFFLDNSVGWAVGEQEEWKVLYKLFDKEWGVIKHTTDGGKTWETQFKGLMSNKRFGAALDRVFFINPDMGWVVGNKGAILHTEDGGKHWEQQKSGDVKFFLRGIYFINSQIGWIIGTQVTDYWTGVVLRTEDGGKHWLVQHKIADIWLDSIYFINEKSGWVTGETEYVKDGWLFHTEDGGKKWSEKPFGPIGGSVIAFLDKDRGIMSSDKGFLVITRNGGKTWTKIKRPLKKTPWHFSEIFEKIGDDNK